MQQTNTTVDPAPFPEMPVLEDDRPRMWTPIGWKRHLLVVASLLVLVSGTYSNSYISGMALDNRYIIEEYYKMVLHNDRNLDPTTFPQVKLLFKYDYWWPKGISGLYRPITSFSYWVDCILLTGKAPKVDFEGRRISDNKGVPVAPEVWNSLSWHDYFWAPGEIPTGTYHTNNIIIHWINAVLIYFIALSLMNSMWPAVFTAALFATHPITTESVTNIIGRADMFAAISTFGGLLLYMRSTFSKGAERIPWLVGLMFICLFGFLSKESAVAIGAIVPLYWFAFKFDWKAPDKWQKLGVEFGCWCFMLPPLIAMLVIRYFVFKYSTPAEEPFLDNPIRGIWQVQSLNIPSFAAELARRPLLGVSFIECKMTAIKVMGKLLVLVAWPWTLCCDYSYNQIPNFSFTFQQGWEDVQAIVSLVALLGIAAAAVWLYIRKHRAAFFFIAFFFLAALPTSNFIYTIGSVMAERFMYLPLAGFTGLLSLGAFTLGKKIWEKFKLIDRADVPSYSVIAIEVLSLIVIIYGVRAYFRNFVWKNDVTLWTDAIQHSPNSFRSYQSLAFAKYETNQSPQGLDEIIEIDKQGLPIVETLPNHLNSSRMYLHLGMYYLMRGDTFVQMMPNGDVTVPPEAQICYRNAITVLEKGSLVDRAFNEINRTKQILRGDNPDNITDVGLAPIYNTLGMAYARMRIFDDAFKRFQYMLQLDPSDSDAYIRLGMLHNELKHPDLAAIAFIEAILMDPNPRRPDYWNYLIQTYATMGDVGKNAIVYENNEPKLNIQDGSSIARQHLALAYRDFIRIFLQAHSPGKARDARQAAIERYGFPAAMFDPLFQEPINIITPQGTIRPGETAVPMTAAPAPVAVAPSVPFTPPTTAPAASMPVQ
ncbi:MAG TPA: hypothetical protein VHD56_15475 [Tepidisphaeraceae bacterium]|nr:hypothetical protein [Tepidisphaeraceae bacterium]